MSIQQSRFWIGDFGFWIHRERVRGRSVRLRVDCGRWSDRMKAELRRVAGLTVWVGRIVGNCGKRLKPLGRLRAAPVHPAEAGC